MNALNRVTAASSIGCLLLMLPLSATAIDGTLNAQVASKIIEGCVTHAKAKRQSHAIAVYDAGGHPVALLRMDGNTPGATEFAMQKAAAVAHWGFSTAEMNAAAKETPGFGNAPRVVTVPGGLPVYSGEGRQFIGAVGVSGEAPQDDAACAAAGISAAGLSPVHKAAG
jgi:glc operon protein GlcG